MSEDKKVFNIVLGVDFLGNHTLYFEYEDYRINYKLDRVRFNAYIQNSFTLNEITPLRDFINSAIERELEKKERKKILAEEYAEEAEERKKREEAGEELCECCGSWS
jgi:hypothetical protein